MTIKIKGVIGYDVRGTEFADMISRLTGDIDFEIDSPGGSVFDGISIFNAIKNYSKGKCHIHVVGDCSSMAAYIMLAGDTLKFEPNSVVVLHNPWTVAIGDYNEMAKQADILERLAALYAIPFVKKGLFSETEIRAIMDAETWFVGSKELKKLGEVVGEDEEIDREIAIAACREKIKECKATLRQYGEDTLDKIAALLPKSPQGFSVPAASKLPKPQTETQVNTTSNKGENTMVANLEELKAQKPAIYTEARNEGIKAEKARVTALMEFIDIDKQAAIDAIVKGETIIDNPVLQAKFLKAQINLNTIKGMEAQNPEGIDPQEETHAPENEGQPKAADEEKEAKALEKILGLCGIDEK